jgi:hypothetical protein
MQKVKCSKCGLVDKSDEIACRRCGALFDDSGRGSVFFSSANLITRSIPVLPIAGIAVATVIAYWYLGSSQAPTTSMPDEQTISNSTPAPTITLRNEHEQKAKGAYFNAIRNSPGIADSQKRLEETQRSMQNETPKPQK